MLGLQGSKCTNNRRVFPLVASLKICILSLALVELVHTHPSSKSIALAALNDDVGG
jgi:hypothetical protein